MGDFAESLSCLNYACHYHIHEGQGVTSKEECIRGIEAGYNVYNHRADLKQLEWEWDDL